MTTVITAGAQSIPHSSFSQLRPNTATLAPSAGASRATPTMAPNPNGLAVAATATDTAPRPQHSSRKRIEHDGLDQRDAPPTKRTKGVLQPLPPQSAQANRGPAPRKKTVKTSKYDESDGGFVFTRGKRKRQPQLLAENAENANTDALSTSNPPSARIAHAKNSGKGGTTTRLKEDNQQTRQQTDRSADTPDSSQRPKSKRIEETIQSKLNFQSTQDGRTRNQEPAPAAPNGHHHTPAKPTQPTTIALPLSDTPIIRRNKEMRRGGQANRRSSVGMRGRRASSLIESGESIAIPHSNVPTKEFYKHIDQGMLEPKRMKCLLTWCAARARTEEQPPDDSSDPNDVLVNEMVKQITSDLVKDLSTRDELSNWFVRDDSPTRNIIRIENPKNVQMAERVRQLERDIEKLKAEKAEWEHMKRLPLKLEPPPSLAALGPDRIDVSALDPDMADIYTSLFPSASPTAPASASTAPPIPRTVARQAVVARATAALAAVEPSVDAFADGVHRISQFRLAGDRMIDHLLSLSAAFLDSRDREERDQEIVFTSRPAHRTADATDADPEQRPPQPEYRPQLERVKSENRVTDIGHVLGALSAVLSNTEE